LARLISTQEEDTRRTKCNINT